jgi:hypothetical protein
MKQNSNGEMKQREEPERKEQRIFKAFYSKTEMINYYVDQILS